jgi:hypothetical protein
MSAKSVTAVAVGLVAVAAIASAPAPAAAAVTYYYYYGYGGGSEISAADSTVTSQLSAESAVLTPYAGVQDTNTVASVEALGVLSLGAVNTSARTSAITGGQQVSVTAQAADVNVLNGLVTATAVTTTTTVKRVNGVYTATAHSDFANLHILGVTLPVDIPQNYALKVGDIATVSMNDGLTSVQGDLASAVGSGLRVTLLKAEGSAKAGTEIEVTPTFATVAPDQTSSTGHSTIGNAYATRITAVAGSTVNVRSAPTAQTIVPAQGTGGKTLTNSLASLDLASVGTTGAVQTTGVGTNTTTVASVTMTAGVSDLNLLSGLITAQAVKVTAHADLSKRTATMTSVNLKVGGTIIPLTVKPNTVINLGVGRVIVNQRIRSSTSITVRAVDIVLAKATNGLPSGAEIQVASAKAGVS